MKYYILTLSATAGLALVAAEPASAQQPPTVSTTVAT